MITERSKNFEGMVCKECERGDRLYSDLHGIFCARCGPSVPVISEMELHQDKRGGRLHSFATIDARYGRSR